MPPGLHGNWWTTQLTIWRRQLQRQQRQIAKLRHERDTLRAQFTGATDGGPSGAAAVEEGVPPAGGGPLEAELHALGLRPLIRRAEQWGVDGTKLDAARTTDTIVSLIAERMRAEGASLEPGVPRVVKPCSRRCGHALGKLLPILLARMVVVSTPEFGPGPGAGEFLTPVMSGLERLAGYIFPSLIAAYDFKGSSSAQECEEQIPDCDLVRYFGHGWEDSVTITKTQWFRYWSGRVRSALASVAVTAQALADDLVIDGADSPGMRFAAGSRTVFAVSISGGPITRTEREALPGLISGTVSDLSARALDVGQVYVPWLHFESLDDFLKALQGYGGIDLGGAMQARKKFDLPGQWVDGDYQEQYDILRQVPGTTPEARRAFLLEAAAPSQEKLNTQLLNAMSARSTERVRELLGLDATNAPLPAGKRPALCADPDSRAPGTGDSMLSCAGQWFNLGAAEALLAAGADPTATNHNGFDALAKTVQFGRTAPVGEPGVPEAVAATIDLCAQAELGMPYAEHVARLTVGAAVTWTLKNQIKRLGESEGTIVEVLEGGYIAVEGKASGQRATFNAGQLQLA